MYVCISNYAYTIIYIYIIMHFSHLRFWLLVQIWKFDWFLKLLLLTFNCYFIAYLITENVEKKKKNFYQSSDSMSKRRKMLFSVTLLI